MAYDLRHRHTTYRRMGFTELRNDTLIGRYHRRERRPRRKIQKIHSWGGEGDSE